MDPYAKNLLAFIRDAEAPQGYEDVYTPLRAKLPKPITQMTVGEVMAWQAKMAEEGSFSTAVGGYQIIRSTLANAVRKTGVSKDALFNEETQDKLGMFLLNERGYAKFAAGEMEASEFAKRLSMEWAALPVLADGKGHHGPVRRGQSYYDGDGVNGATRSPEDFMAVLTGGTPSPRQTKAPSSRQLPRDTGYGAPLQDGVEPSFRRLAGPGEGRPPRLGLDPENGNPAPYGAYRTDRVFNYAGDPPQSLVADAWDNVRDSFVIRNIEAVVDPRPNKVDPGFNPFEEMQRRGQTEHHKWLSQARSREDYDVLARRLENELRREERISRRGSLAAMLIGGALMPENITAVAIPTNMGGIARSATGIGLIGAGLEAANEWHRYRMDPNRGRDEVIGNIAGAFIMGGAFGAGAGALNNMRRRASNAVARVDDLRKGVSLEALNRGARRAWQEASVATKARAIKAVVDPEPHERDIITPPELRRQGLEIHAYGGETPGGSPRSSERKEHAGTDLDTVFRQADEEIDAELAATWGQAAWTRKLRLGDQEVRVRRDGIPEWAPLKAQENGFFYDSVRRELHIDPGMVKRLFQRKAWLGMGIDESAFKNAFEFEEFLARYALKLEELGVSASHVKRSSYVQGPRGLIHVNKDAKIDWREARALYMVSRDEEGRVLSEGIALDMDKIRQAFDEKMWQRPRGADGGDQVPPVLPEGKDFKRLDDFVDFILTHEQMHAYFSKPEGMTAAQYEHLTDKRALKMLGLDEGVGFEMRDAQAELRRKAGSRALREFENWRKGPFKREIKGKIARAIDRMMPTAYKRVLRSALSGPARMMAEVLIGDASLAAMGRQIGATTGESVEMGVKTWLGQADTLVRQYERLYVQYLGGKDFSVGGMSMTAPFRRTREDGSKAMSKAEFGRRAALLHMTGDAAHAGDVAEIRQLAASIKEFYGAFENDARRLGLFGPMTPEIAEARITHLNKQIDRLYDRIPKVTEEKADELREIMADLKNQLDDIEASRVLPEGERVDEDYFTRIWDRNAIRQFPKTFREIVRQHFIENNSIAVLTNEGKWVHVRADPANIEARVDQLIEKLSGQESTDLIGAALDSMNRTELEINPVGGASSVRRRTFNIPNKKIAGLRRQDVHPDERHLMDGDIVSFIETDPQAVGMYYTQRMSRLIEYSRRFADPAAGINADVGFRLAMREIKETERLAFMRKFFANEAAGKDDADFIRGMMAPQVRLMLKESAAFREIAESVSGMKFNADGSTAGGPPVNDPGAVKLASKAWEEHWAPIERDLITMRDRVMERTTTEPARWDNRMARLLKNLTYPIYLGMSGLVTTIDSTRLVAAFGTERVWKSTLQAFGKDTRGLWLQAAGDAQRAGALGDMTLGLVARKLSEMAMDPIHMTALERGAEWLGTQSFLANLMAPITVAMRSMAGVLGSEELLGKAIRVAGGTADEGDVSFLKAHGLNDADIRAIAKEHANGNIQITEEGLYLGNVDKWENQNVARKYKAALHQLIDNVIIIASNADKPDMVDGVLHFRKGPMMDGFASKYGWTSVGDYWRVQSGLISMPFHLMNYTFAATQKVAVATAENPNARAIGAMAAMVFLGYMIQQARVPDYVWDEMGTSEKILRSIDQSGAAGVIPEIIWSAQDATMGLTGINPFPIDPKFDNVSGWDRIVNLLGPGADIVGNVGGGAYRLATGQDAAMHTLGMAAPLRNNVIFGDFVQSLVPDDRE